MHSTKQSTQFGKCEIVAGNDMFPSIMPHEKLLLDRTSNPKQGDVIVFNNRFNIPIAHRVIHKCGNYYFTRGDNCPCLNHPCHKNSVLGVIQGKNKKIKISFFMKALLNLFLPYFCIYSIFNNLQKKKNFLYLELVTRFFIPLESIYYPSSNHCHPLNTLIFSPPLESSLSPPDFYLRKAIDNQLLPKENQSAEINLNSVNHLNKLLSSINRKIIIPKNTIYQNKIVVTKPYRIRYQQDWKGRIMYLCTTIYNKGSLTIADLIHLSDLIHNQDIKNIEFENQGQSELLCIPFTVLRIFDKKYNQESNNPLSTFVNNHYPAQLSQLQTYFEKHNFNMPLFYYDLSKNSSIPIISYIKPAREFLASSPKVPAILSLFAIAISKFSNFRRKRYMKKSANN